jgi:hypothetical protein
MMAKLMGVVERLQQELFRADAARLAAERCVVAGTAPGAVTKQHRVWD